MGLATLGAAVAGEQALLQTDLLREILKTLREIRDQGVVHDHTEAPVRSASPEVPRRRGWHSRDRGSL